MKFEKVSFAQYCNDCGYSVNYGYDLLEGCRKEYDDIKLPKRATIGSAGYDFFMPFSIDLEPNETIKIPTSIKWVANSWNNFILQIYPRSGLGFKYQLGICNTVGIIDSDYRYATNEGHIMIKLVNRGTEPLSLNKGDGFAQGIISEYFTVDDDVDTVGQDTRTGGFGSTDKI